MSQANRVLPLGSLVQMTLGQRQSLIHFRSPAPKHKAWLSALSSALGGDGTEEGRQGGRKGGEEEERREEGKEDGSLDRCFPVSSHGSKF